MKMECLCLRPLCLLLTTAGAQGSMSGSCSGGGGERRYPIQWHMCVTMPVCCLLELSGHSWGYVDIFAQIFCCAVSYDIVFESFRNLRTYTHIVIYQNFCLCFGQLSTEMAFFSLIYPFTNITRTTPGYKLVLPSLPPSLSLSFSLSLSGNHSMKG